MKKIEKGKGCLLGISWIYLFIYFLFKEKQWINKEYWEEMSDDERPDRERKCCLMGVTFITSSRKG